jgi:hypothetical protein
LASVVSNAIANNSFYVSSHQSDFAPLSFPFACFLPTITMSFLSFRLKSNPEEGYIYPQNSYSSIRSRRRQLACVSIIGLSMVILLFIWNTQPQVYWQAASPIASPSIEHEPLQSNHSLPQIPEEKFDIEPSPLNALAVLNGSPTEHFRGMFCYQTSIGGEWLTFSR